MRTITLSNGEQVLVDDDDYDYVNHWKWVRSNGGYAQRGIRIKTRTGRRGGTLLMHRVIMQAKKGQSIDHINGNPLDNQKSNLRFCTQKQNLRNRRLSKRSKTGYRGVTNSYKGKYRAIIAINGANKHLGMFDTAEEASRAYNAVAFQIDPEFWQLN